MWVRNPPIPIKFGFKKSASVRRKRRISRTARPERVARHCSHDAELYGKALTTTPGRQRSHVGARVPIKALTGDKPFGRTVRVTFWGSFMCKSRRWGYQRRLFREGLQASASRAAESSSSAWNFSGTRQPAKAGLTSGLPRLGKRPGPVSRPGMSSSRGSADAGDRFAVVPKANHGTADQRAPGDGFEPPTSCV